MEGKLYSGLELNSEPQRPGLVGGGVSSPVALISLLLFLPSPL